MLSPLLTASTSTSRPESVVDCSNFTAAVEVDCGTSCRAKMKLNVATSRVQTMMIIRRRRMISQWSRRFISYCAMLRTSPPALRDGPGVVEERRFREIQELRRGQPLALAVGEDLHLGAQRVVAIDRDHAPDLVRVESHDRARWKHRDLGEQRLDQRRRKLIVARLHDLANGLVGPLARPRRGRQRERGVGVDERDDLRIGIDGGSVQTLREALPLLALVVLQNRLRGV